VTRDHDRLAGALLDEVARIHARGWCPATSGNYSVVVGAEPLTLLITRSGADKGRLERSDLLLVDEQGAPLEGGAARPSAEVALHVTLARALAARAVLHTHTVWNTLVGERFAPAGELVLEGYELLKAFTGVDTHACRRRVPIFANTQRMEELAGRLPAALAGEETAPGFLIAGHGLYAWGDDLRSAVRHLEALEFLFEVAWRGVGRPATRR
jgi:methylthioribulose-1-phosphate dehydratase